MPHVPAFLVAGTKSGCGKTSVSLGLMAAFARQGLAVQPFKAGPDFIDPGHHARAASLSPPSHPIESHNLDTWMLSQDAVRSLFARYASGGDAAPDVVVVEGVMGLFDGVSGLDEQGSSAHLAKTLGLPVVLVADASSLARSAAALVKGYAEFDSDLNMAGVILNNVASDNHADLLRQALSQVDAPLLGLLPRQESIRLPSRHLGLHTAGEGEADQIYHGLADWVEAHMDLDALLARLPGVDVEPPKPEPEPEPCVRLGVARDQAFCFLYPENLRLLRAAGAEIVFFSPLADRALPDGLDGLYFPGGYPELHAEALEANAGLRNQVLDFARSGRPVYAECGGFMYLMRALADRAGRWYFMVGVFDVGAEMGERFAALGYRKAETRADTLLGPAGTTLRGHEFHYSRLAAQPAQAKPVYRVTGRDDRILETTGWQKGSVLGSYVHLHFGSKPGAAANFVHTMRAMQG